jgi:hypothetical protein
VADVCVISGKRLTQWLSCVEKQWQSNAEELH